MKIVAAAVAGIAGSLMVYPANRVTSAEFGKTKDGVSIQLFTLTNSRAMEVKVTNYGGIVVSILVPDRKGVKADVVLGFDSLDGYLQNSPFFGAIVGRYANRIAKGRFVLDGVEYKLPVNNGANTLHGGPQGFDKQVWSPRMVGDALELSYLSKDGEAGFPGNLKATVTYRVTDANELRIDYAATADKATVVNLTNHSYFNLAGAGSGDILRHTVSINADRFTPVDRDLIPTGEMRSVAGTPFNLRKPTLIGTRIDDADEQLKIGGGYDHNFVLNKSREGLSPAARVEDRASGRVLEVSTTEPGVQFYTANSLRDTTGKAGRTYGRRAAFCLETQHFPDSPNQPKFPSTVLRPGRQYRSTTVYKFPAASIRGHEQLH